MKKCLCLLAFIGFLGVNVHAKEFSLSAGLGTQMGGLFTNYRLDANGEYSGNPVHVHATQDVSQFNIGILAFFDATYLEASLFYQWGFNDYNIGYDISMEGVQPFDPRKGKGKEGMLGFSFLGKYPFTINSRFTVFPLLGIEYQIAMQEKRKDDDYPVEYDVTSDAAPRDSNGKNYKLSAWNSVIIDVGAGADFFLTREIFLRGELLCGFRLMTDYESDSLENVKKKINARGNPSMGGITAIPVFKIAGGYKFFKR